MGHTNGNRQIGIDLHLGLPGEGGFHEIWSFWFRHLIPQLRNGLLHTVFVIHCQNFRVLETGMAYRTLAEAWRDDW